MALCREETGKQTEQENPPHPKVLSRRGEPGSICGFHPAAVRDAVNRFLATF